MSADGPIHHKYIVSRVDGNEGPGTKHDGCFYFVLDLTHDPYAAAAVRAYADACEATHPQLAAELRARVERRMVHVYRNRDDDDRPREEMHFCEPCNGWYGVPHTMSHCQRRMPAGFGEAAQCACAFCRIAHRTPVEGRYGFFTDALEWQPAPVVNGPTGVGTVAP
jgi:hypothetical protein